MRGLAFSLFAFASSLFASVLVSASVAQASVSISVTCTSNVATFAITGLTLDETFTMSVSQNGSSDWTNLGVAPPPAESMIIPVPMEGNEDLASITSYNSAIYRVASGDSVVTAVCS